MGIQVWTHFRILEYLTFLFEGHCTRKVKESTFFKEQILEEFSIKGYIKKLSESFHKKNVVRKILQERYREIYYFPQLITCSN